MKTADLIQSNFLRKADLMDQPMILTIADCTVEDSGFRKRAQQAVLWFEETHKGLGLNNTKLKTLEEAYGPDTEQWTGRRVRLSFDPTVKMGPAVVGGIKLETPRVVSAAAAAVPVAPRGTPPPPVWDPAAQAWIVQQPAPTAPTAPPGAPPPPVWDGKQWVTAAPPSVAPAAPAAPGESFGPPPRTLAQIVKDNTNAKGEFDDDIPF